MNARTTIAALTAAAVLTLTGCAGSGGSPSSEPAPELSPSSSTTLPPGSNYGEQYQPPAEPTEPAPPEVATLGKSYTWPDGLKVGVSTPTAAQLTADDKQVMDIPADWKAVHLTVTVTVPKAGPAFDPAELVLAASSGDEEAQHVFITGSDSPPSTRVLPGRSIKTRMTFAVKDPKDLTVQVLAGWERDEAVFTS